MKRLLATLAIAFVPALAFAEPIAQLAVSDPPHYAGAPIEVQIVAQGFDEDPEPEITGSASGGTLELAGVSPSVSTSIQIINGQLTQTRDVRFVYTYRFLAPDPDRYTLGPFTVRQSSREAATRAVTLSLGTIPLDPEQKLALVAPGRPVVVGERFPLRVEWWVPEGIAGGLRGPALRVPAFLDLDSFRFSDPGVPEARNAIDVVLPGGVTQMPLQQERREQGGKIWLVLFIERSAVALVDGRLDLGPAELTVDRATQFRRDLFGGRVATGFRRTRVTAEAAPLEVVALPEEGRPASFAGAVGSGYSIEVTADRTVVHAGDPLRLTVRVRGERLDTVALPPLEAAGLDPKDFRLPGEESAGRFTDAGKEFEVPVRVLHEGVGEIPALRFSWFDPARNAYETAESRPIALSVRPATVVSADDVVRGSEPAAPGESPRDPDPATAARTFSLSGADLAIETARDRLEGGGGGPLSRNSLLLLHGIGLAGLFAGWIGRLRTRAPESRADSRELHRLEREIANGDARAMAAALRVILSRHDPGDRDGIDRILAECDALAFAPGGGAAPSPELRERARNAIRRGAEKAAS